MPVDESPSSVSQGSTVTSGENETLSRMPIVQPNPFTVDKDWENWVSKSNVALVGMNGQMSRNATSWAHIETANPTRGIVTSPRMLHKTGEPESNVDEHI